MNSLLDAFRGRAEESLGPFRVHAEFKSGFQTNDSSHEIFNVVVLLSYGGVELLDLISKFNRGGKGVPYTFCPPRD
ncbi:MAG: hypothetical protein ACREIJ_08335 [Nitrospiraceae bacterium]